MIGNWRDDAACVEAPPELFDLQVPARMKSERAAQGRLVEATITRYCNNCPVRKECGDEGRRNQLFGIWGGKLRGEVEHEHGTHSGYESHRRLGTPPCDDCTAGHGQYLRDRLARLAKSA